MHLTITKQYVLNIAVYFVITDGYASGSVNLEWQTKTFDYDRGRKFAGEVFED